MATHKTLSSLFSAIANKIRSYTGTTSNIVADNFPNAITDVYNKGFSDGKVPTGFTDLARATTTVIRDNYRVNGSGALGSSTGNTVISFKNPKQGQAIRMVYRGAFVVNGTTNIASGTSSSAGGTLISANVASIVGLNEQGDFYIDIPAEQSLAWIHFSFAGLTSVRFPIIAVDEFIGFGHFSTEEWTLEMNDGTTVTKEIAVC